MAGAGPGGLASALYLSRAGHRVHLFERFARPQPVGSGLMLQPTGLAVLADLGLGERTFALGARIDRLSGTDARTGRVVLDVGYWPLGRHVHAVGMHRATLFNLLHEPVGEARLPMRTAYAVSAVERDTSRIWLRSPNGLEGPFDLVVDAMGAGSPLRAEAPGTHRQRSLAFGAIWGTVPWVDEGFSRHALSQRYVRAKVMIGVLPLGRRTRGGIEEAAFFWSLKPGELSGLQQGGFEAFSAEVRRHWPATAPHLAALGGFEALTLARYAHQTLTRPVGDRIAFVGDSAHSTSPQLGQGANMALLDAAALSAALASTDDLADALGTYARLRR
ncbi:FAD-dependent oxidoreductase, partial [Devosia sp.]|uniref:FAD-dependent oxidoreductase n=1 Tax=Devosia sp. TaxID=1871048 RepID=UPI0035B0828E